jgi:isopenicillin N synthase-like dioxygenase
VYFHSGSEATYRKVSEKPTGFTSIPTIDISNLDGTSSQRKAIAAEIREACEKCGFFYIKNHSIPQDTFDEVFESLKRFFALEHDVKMDAHVQKNPAIRGYEPMLETRLDPRTRGGKPTLVLSSHSTHTHGTKMSKKPSPWATATLSLNKISRVRQVNNLHPV